MDLDPGSHPCRDDGDETLDPGSRPESQRVASCANRLLVTPDADWGDGDEILDPGSKAYREDDKDKSVIINGEDPSLLSNKEPSFPNVPIGNPVA